MSGRPAAVAESDLHARLDGQLSGRVAESVDAYLAAHPEEQQRWADYAGQRRALRAAFGAPAGEPVPARLRVGRIVAERHRRRQRRFALIAAGIGLFVVGGIAGRTAPERAGILRWLPATSAGSARIITADAISAYRTFSVEVRHPVEVDAAQEPHLVQWLSKRLGRRLVVPDLTAAGFRLMGGRLLPAEETSAAQFMYQDDKGQRLELYLRSGIGGETAFRYQEDSGIGAFYWSDQGFGYAIAAKADRDLLRRVSELVYRQTSGDNGKAKLPPVSGKSG